ncbi:GNAT family N-acetyltransferase, partial [Haloarchaeobius iranensis]
TKSRRSTSIARIDFLGFALLTRDNRRLDRYSTRHKIQDRTRWAEIAISIAPEHWGNGYATEASELIVDYAFTERNLHRLQARVIEPNDASASVWEKLGFTREGTLRENQFYEGEYVGTRYYGLLEDEWEGR